VKRSNLIITVVVVCICAVASLAMATPISPTYSGTLTSGNGLVGTASWETDVSLSYEVTSLDGGLWKYEYTLTVESKDISHFIIETSLSFQASNIVGGIPGGITSDVTLGEIELQMNTEQEGNPNLPESLYGIKINLNEDSTTVTASFISDRDPVWGDFYAKGGKDGNPKVDLTLYNTGFTAADPLLAPDANVTDHILVPDTTPEPATLTLLGLGAVMVLIRKRKRA